MKKRTNNVVNLIVSAILFVAILCGQAILSAFSLPTFATVSEYSDVLDDLSRDETFDASDFPELDTLPDMPYDLLDVIQIAEGDKGSLYIYVYAPYDTKPAEYITMSLSKQTDYSRYKIKLCSANGALEKYVVDGFKTKDARQRAYLISAIYYPYDVQFSDYFEVDCYSATIDNFWIAEGKGDNVVYRTKEIDNVIQIPAEDLYAGYIFYPTGFFLIPGRSNVNSNFIAFRSDIQIDKLMSAKVVYDLHYKYFSMAGFITSQNEEGVKENEEVFLSEEDSVTLEDWHYKYEWERIQSAKEFIATEDLTDEAKGALANFDWVLRFCETENYTYTDGNYTTINREWVENAQILQLTYKTAGKVYTVGVVSDVVTPDNTPENDVVKTGIRGFFNSVFGDLTKLLYLIIGLVLLGVLAPLWFPIVQIIFTGLWWLVSAPFKAIANAVKKRKNKKKGAQNLKHK